MTALLAFVLGAAVAGGGLAWWGTRLRRRQRQLVDALSATRQQLDGMLANLSEAVTVTDRGRRMRYANQTAADLLGYATPQELIAEPLGAIAAGWESSH